MAKKTYTSLDRERLREQLLDRGRSCSPGTGTGRPP